MASRYRSRASPKSGPELERRRRRLDKFTLRRPSPLRFLSRAPAARYGSPGLGSVTNESLHTCRCTSVGVSVRYAELERLCIVASISGTWTCLLLLRRFASRTEELAGLALSFRRLVAAHLELNERMILPAPAVCMSRHSVLDSWLLGGRFVSAWRGGEFSEHAHHSRASSPAIL